MATTFHSRGEITPDQFGLNLARARVRRGLSQAKLAEEVKTSQALIARYERGRVMPTAPRIKALADALDVRADLLMTPN